RRRATGPRRRARLLRAGVVRRSGAAAQAGAGGLSHGRHEPRRVSRRDAPRGRALVGRRGCAAGRLRGRVRESSGQGARSPGAGAGRGRAGSGGGGRRNRRRRRVRPCPSLERPRPTMTLTVTDRILCCLTGSATGDAIGKQTEMLSHEDVLHWYPHGIRGVEGTPGSVIPRYLRNEKNELRSVYK